MYIYTFRSVYNSGYVKPFFLQYLFSILVNHFGIIFFSIPITANYFSMSE